MRRTHGFYEHFAKWLDDCLAEPLPEELLAFSLSLIECDLCFRVEVTGTGEFDEFGSAWTWAELWAPAAGALTIPSAVCNGSRDRAWKVVEAAVRRYLVTGMWRGKLCSRRAVALDTLEAGARILWQSTSRRDRAVSGEADLTRM